MLMIPQPVKNPSSRDGIGFRSSDIDRFLIAGNIEWLMVDGRIRSINPAIEGDYIMSDVEKAYEKANDVISLAQGAFNKTLSTFRATIKNDLTSISSASNRVSNEAVKMNTTYSQTIETLNSKGMEDAILNAERLAAALEAISAIKPTDVNFKFLEK
jgi:hypothetical protein